MVEGDRHKNAHLYSKENTKIVLLVITGKIKSPLNIFFKTSVAKSAPRLDMVVRKIGSLTFVQGIDYLLPK